jgi:hypothetical protein
MLWSYGREAEAIAVGSTGGGPDIEGQPQAPALNWEELARNLRLARQFTDQIYIHSLEGCVWQGFLTRMRSLDWNAATTRPDTAWAGAALRSALRTTLWTSAHPLLSAAAALAAASTRRASNRAA